MNKFLPLKVRIGLYVASVVVGVVAPFVAVAAPDYATAATVAGGVLLAASGAVALANRNAGDGNGDNAA